jgi:hypothetical protein
MVMATKSPLDSVKESFENKAKLVAELEKFTKDDDLWVSRKNAGKGLIHVSNAKLLRLHRTFSAVKEKFGTRAKLIDAILEVEKRVKDEGYKTRLTAFPVPRLWDLYNSAARRAGVGAPKEKAARKPAARAEKKAPADRASTKKVAAKSPAKKAAASKKSTSSKKR